MFNTDKDFHNAIFFDLFFWSVLILSVFDTSVQVYASRAIHFLVVIMFILVSLRHYGFMLIERGDTDYDLDDEDMYKEATRIIKLSNYVSISTALEALLMFTIGMTFTSILHIVSWFIIMGTTKLAKDYVKRQEDL